MEVLPELVREINLASGANPSDLTEVNGTLYFAADDGTAQVDLWKSDGTSAGTVLLTKSSASEFVYADGNAGGTNRHTNFALN